MITNTASSTEITVLSVKKLPIAVMTPIDEQRDVRETVPRVQSAERAEEDPVRAPRCTGTREPPSSPANTEPNAVMQDEDGHDVGRRLAPRPLQHERRDRVRLRRLLPRHDAEHADLHERGR